MADLDYLCGRLEAYRAASIDRTLSPHDTMRHQTDSTGRAERVAEDDYLAIGRSAIENIFTALCASWVHRVRRVLDLPCGHGRVLRHLVKMFPEAEFDACDLDADGVRFCADTFGANPIQSQKDLARVELPGDYDLIWVGSLFTHTSRRTTNAWLRHLIGALARHGVVVATFHGRWSERAYDRIKYIKPRQWRQIVADYRESGYGYADYPRRFLGLGASRIGVSLARPSALVRDFEAIPGVRLMSYVERGWADHQDVAVLGRQAHDAPWPGMGAGGAETG